MLSCSMCVGIVATPWSTVILEEMMQERVLKWVIRQLNHFGFESMLRVGPPDSPISKANQLDFVASLAEYHILVKGSGSICIGW